MVPIVDVFTSLAGEAAEVHVGTCRFSLRRGRISCSFAYSDAYLKRADAYAIDPALPLRSTFYHCEGMPGAMRDSSPDRWGRHLIDRRAIAEAQAAGATLRAIDEVDYLLGEICGLTAEEKSRIVRQTLTAVRRWRTFAKRNGCKDSECDLMGRVIEERCAALESRFAR